MSQSKTLRERIHTCGRSTGSPARFAHNQQEPVGRHLGNGSIRLAYAAWWNEYVIVGIQVESVEAVTNVKNLAKSGISVVTFGPKDLTFSLEGHPSYPLQNVDDCMRSVYAQLEGTGIRMAMGTATKPSERGKYLDIGITLFQENAPE